MTIFYTFDWSVDKIIWTSYYSKNTVSEIKK